MNVVDSSAWLEYFANGPNAQFFAPAIEDSEQLLVPTLILYDVFKRVLQQKIENGLAERILRGAIEDGSHVVIDAADAIADEITTFNNKAHGTLPKPKTEAPKRKPNISMRRGR